MTDIYVIHIIVLITYQQGVVSKGVVDPFGQTKCDNLETDTANETLLLCVSLEWNIKYCSQYHCFQRVCSK